MYIVFKEYRLIKVTLLLLLMCMSFGSVQATSLSYNDDGTVAGYSLPDIRPAGLPNFENNISASWDSSLKIHKKTGVIKSGKAKLQVTYIDGTFLFNDPTGSHSVTNGSFSLNARFDYNLNTGEFDLIKNPSVTINGGVTNASGSANGTGVGNALFSAILSSWAFDDDLIGFNSIIDPSSEICTITGCSAAESIYLSLINGGFDPLNLSNYENKHSQYLYTSDGLAVSTIPAPAAAWLFCSGLICIIGMAKRRRI